MSDSLVELPSLAPKRICVHLSVHPFPAPSLVPPPRRSLRAVALLYELLAVIGVAQAVVVDDKVVRLLSLADELLVLFLGYLVVDLVIVVLMGAFRGRPGEAVSKKVDR